MNLMWDKLWLILFKCSVGESLKFASVCISSPNTTQGGRKNRGVRSRTLCCAPGVPVSSRCGWLGPLPFSEAWCPHPRNECLPVHMAMSPWFSGCLVQLRSVCEPPPLFCGARIRRPYLFCYSFSVFLFEFVSTCKNRDTSFSNLDGRLLLMKNKIWPLRNTYLTTTTAQGLRSCHPL